MLPSGPKELRTLTHFKWARGSNDRIIGFAKKDDSSAKWFRWGSQLSIAKPFTKQYPDNDPMNFSFQNPSLYEMGFAKWWQRFIAKITSARRTFLN